MQNMKGRLTLTFAVRLHVDVLTTPYLSIKILKLCFKRLHLVCARFVCNFRRTSYQIKGMKAYTVRDIISVLRALFFYQNVILLLKQCLHLGDNFRTHDESIFILK